MTLYFLLPAYNEAENIPALMEKIGAFAKTSKHSCKIVLVDDGSIDGTADAAVQAAQKNPSLELISAPHPRNLGLAEALRTGLKKILSIARPEDCIVTMDADNSHDPALISLIISVCPQGGGAIASRYLRGSDEVGLSPLRKLLSGACNAMLRIFFPIRGVTDYTCGYRLISVDLVRTLAKKSSERFFEAKGFVATSELLINLARSGGAFAEAPLVLRYDLKRGQSKMRIFRTIFDYAGLLLRHR